MSYSVQTRARGTLDILNYNLFTLLIPASWIVHLLAYPAQWLVEVKTDRAVYVWPHCFLSQAAAFDFMEAVEALIEAGQWVPIGWQLRSVWGEMDGRGRSSSA